MLTFYTLYKVYKAFIKMSKSRQNYLNSLLFYLGDFLCDSFTTCQSPQLLQSQGLISLQIALQLE